MSRVRRATAVAIVMLAATGSGASGAWAQDAEPVVRHLLPLGYGRVTPFRRVYDMLVQSGDSLVHLGERVVALDTAWLADSSAGWILMESRGGVVPATDSILLAPDLRPIRWTSRTGRASLDVAFSGDSAIGNTQLGAATNRIALLAPPDLILSAAMLEMIAGTLPLSVGWHDSVSVLLAGMASAVPAHAELAVAGEEQIAVVDDCVPRWCWHLVLQSGDNRVQLWVDRESGDIPRAELSRVRAGGPLTYRRRVALPPQGR